MRIDAEERSISEVLFFSKASSTRKILNDEGIFWLEASYTRRLFICECERT